MAYQKKFVEMTSTDFFDCPEERFQEDSVYSGIYTVSSAIMYFSVSQKLAEGRKWHTVVHSAYSSSQKNCSYCSRWNRMETAVLGTHVVGDFGTGTSADTSVRPKLYKHMY